MFEKIKSERALREIHDIGRDMTDITMTFPSNSEITSGGVELSNRLSGDGRVNSSYVKDTIIGMNYCQNHYHYLTGNSLIDDINANKRIFLNSYKRI